MDGKRAVWRASMLATAVLAAFVSGCVTVNWGEPTAPVPPVKPVGPGPHTNGVVPAAFPPPDIFHERLAGLLEEIAAAKDAYKALAGRLQYMETLVLEREQSLRLAQKEMDAAAEEMTRARAEHQKLLQENHRLRERIKQLEKENKEVLESVIKMLEQPERSRVPNSVPGRDP
jgi:hypothetical protein